MFKKLAVSIISSIIFCLALSILQYTPITNRQPNTYYFSFFELMSIYLMYATPVFVIGGITCSIIIDKLNKNKTFPLQSSTYLINFGLYSIAGVMTGFIFLLILTGGKVFEGGILIGRWLILSIFASLLFFHVAILTDKVNNIITRDGRG